MTERKNNFDKIIDAFIVYLLTKGRFKFACILLTIGGMVIGPQEFLLLTILRMLVSPYSATLADQIHMTDNSLHNLGIVLIILGTVIGVFDWIAAKIRPIKQIILQYSYHSIASPAIKSIVDPKAQFWKATTHLFFDYKSQHLDIELRKTLKKARKQSKVRPLYYCGMAHLPIVAATGHVLRNFDPVFIEIDHISRAPYLISSEDEELLSVSIEKPIVDVPSSKIVIVAMSISIDIQSFKISQAFPENEQIFHIRVSNPSFSNIKARNQLDNLVDHFRSIVTEIYQKYTRLKTVNLLIAGPTSLVFRIGQNISENTDREILIYHFDLDSNCYSWGISINKGEKIVRLQPTD